MKNELKTSKSLVYALITPQHKAMLFVSSQFRLFMKKRVYENKSL